MAFSYGCRTPDLGDRAVFYGADAISTHLEDYVTKELKKSQVDWGGVIVSIIGIAATENVKSDINRGLCSPLKSFREIKQTERGRLTVRKPRGTLTRRY